MSDPNYPPPPPGGTPPPPPPPPGGTPPPPPGGGFTPPPPPPPPPGGGFPGGFQPYNPGAGGRFIPEINAYQDEPWKRIVGRFIDGVILGIINAILYGAIVSVNASDCLSSRTFSEILDGCSPTASSYIIYGLITTAISAAFYVGFIVTTGSTPGKMAFGLKVVKQDGSAVDPQAALMRWILDGGSAAIAILPFGAGRVLSSLVFLGLAIYNLILLLQDPRQVDLYDKLGGTYVVKK